MGLFQQPAKGSKIEKTEFSDNVVPPLFSKEASFLPLEREGRRDLVSGVPPIMD